MSPTIPTADRTEPIMSTQSASRADPLHDALRQELLRLARHEDDAASREAARVHYWEPVPVTVVVHRQCAAALRDAADELLPH
jgi:hypothetical protein